MGGGEAATPIARFNKKYGLDVNFREIGVFVFLVSEGENGTYRRLGIRNPHTANGMGNYCFEPDDDVPKTHPVRTPEFQEVLYKEFQRRREKAQEQLGLGA